MVTKVGLAGKTNATQKALIPHTPTTVSIEGGSEIPNPRKYPDMFSYAMLNIYTGKIMHIRT